MLISEKQLALILTKPLGGLTRLYIDIFGNVYEDHVPGSVETSACCIPTLIRMCKMLDLRDFGYFPLFSDVEYDKTKHEIVITMQSVIKRFGDKCYYIGKPMDHALLDICDGKRIIDVSPWFAYGGNNGLITYTCTVYEPRIFRENYRLDRELKYITKNIIYPWIIVNAKVFEHLDERDWFNRHYVDNIEFYKRIFYSKIPEECFDDPHLRKYAYALMLIGGTNEGFNVYRTNPTRMIELKERKNKSITSLIRSLYMTSIVETDADGVIDIDKYLDS